MSLLLEGSLILVLNMLLIPTDILFYYILA